MQNVVCPHCRHSMIDDGSLSGQVVACPQCSGQFQMPMGAAPPPLRIPEAQYADAPPFAFPTAQGQPMYLDLGSDPKNSGVAVLLSLVMPGVGQIYNGQILKGVLMMVGYVLSALLCFVIIGIVPLLIIWILGMYDAYNQAESINSAARRRRSGSRH